MTNNQLLATLLAAVIGFGLMGMLQLLFVGVG